MNVLSLFNGMNVCAMALEDAGIEVDTQYISEIDKYANKASDLLFPDAIQLGSVLDWRDWGVDWSSIDLVTGGFPCQAWSMAGKQLGDKDERGMLFWTMLDIIKQVKHYNPKANFLIENVRMKKEFEEYITSHTEKALGEVHKVLINSALVSAQNRNRYYWTSFPVAQPKDKCVILPYVLEGDVDCKFTLSETCLNRLKKYNNASAMLEGFDKSLCLVAGYHKMGRDNTCIKVNGDQYRKLTPRECMRLQTIQEYYIDKLLASGISNTQLYKMTGNAWTMKVISHILRKLIDINDYTK